MSRMTATGPYTVLTHGFLARGDIDQTEGRGGSRDLGRFTEVEEAIQAARGQGVQGDDGEVYAFETRLHEGGLVAEHTTRLRGRRRTPDGRYLVGWLDLREYNDPLPSA